MNLLPQSITVFLNAEKPLSRTGSTEGSTCSLRPTPSPKLGTAPPPYSAFSKPIVPASSEGELDRLAHILSPAPARTASACFQKRTITVALCVPGTVLESDFQE